MGAVFRRDLFSFSDLRVGSELTGRVTNVVDFGAFVDVGLGVSGLVHVSNYRKGGHSDKAPKIGDLVQVKVLNVEHERKRISLGLLKIA